MPGFFDRHNSEASRTRCGEQTPIVADWLLGPPPGAVGTVMPDRLPILRDSSLCVILDRVVVFMTGVLLDLELHLVGNGPSSYEIASEFPWAVRATHRAVDLEAGGLRFGIAYADGSAFTATAPSFHRQLHDIHRHALRFPNDPHIIPLAGHHSRSGRAHSRLWLAPRPQSASIKLILDWPVLGIDEQSYEITNSSKEAAVDPLVSIDSWPPTED